MRTRIKALQHVGLTVADLERSIAFYSALFDVELHGPWLREGPRVGEITGYPGCSVRQCFLSFGRDDQVLELLEYTGGGPAIMPENGSAGAAHFALQIEDDLDALYARLRAQGYKFVSAPMTTSRHPLFDGRIAYLVDPDGFRIELYQPRPR
jgi:catechol 2,3-dioxygenase-like lactoylglutathione lyase family enzyme